MKIKLIFLAIVCFVSLQTTTAQTVDEIIANYFENTGGMDKWEALNGVRMKAEVNQQGMTIPITIVQLKDGRMFTKIDLQGTELYQGVFDGEVLWSDNMMTMKPEKSDNESTENMKRQAGDFPDPFLNYKGKGYTTELLGKETIEGTECYKVKLTRKPQLVDGAEVDNVSYYYFDIENFVPIATEIEIVSGPMKGQVALNTFSDYDEVDGLYFPFSMGQGIKDMGTQAITVTSIELNPEVDASVFTFPETTEGDK